MRNRQEYNKRSTDLQKKMQLKGEVRHVMFMDVCGFDLKRVHLSICIFH